MDVSFDGVSDEDQAATWAKLRETLAHILNQRQDALETVVACDIAIDQVLDEMNQGRPAHDPQP